MNKVGQIKHNRSRPDAGDFRYQKLKKAGVYATAKNSKQQTKKDHFLATCGHCCRGRPARQQAENVRRRRRRRNRLRRRRATEKRRRWRRHHSSHDQHADVDLGTLLRPVNLYGRRAPGMRAPRNTTQFLMRQVYQDMERREKEERAHAPPSPAAALELQDGVLCARDLGPMEGWAAVTGLFQMVQTSEGESFLLPCHWVAMLKPLEGADAATEIKQEQISELSALQKTESIRVVLNNN